MSSLVNGLRMSIARTTVAWMLSFLLSATTQAGSVGHDIIYVPGGISWLESRDSAAALGGQLAVIESQAEQFWVRDMLRPNDTLWLGAADVVVEGAWRWVNGATIDYSSWHQGRIDTAVGADYLQMRQNQFGHWFAANGLAHGFVVEYECCDGIAGDINSDGQDLPDIADLVYLVAFMFDGGPLPPCFQETDIVGQDGIKIDDLVAIASFMFQNGPPPDSCPAPYAVPPDTVEIVDITGKSWDISYGIHYYGLDLDDFGHGLGPFAIQPILNPQFISPGDPGYPLPTDTNDVLGGLIDGEARAYFLGNLSNREVANDHKDSIYFAAAY